MSDYNNQCIQVNGRFHSTKAVIGNQHLTGVVAGADEIYDDVFPLNAEPGAKQSDINSNLKGRLDDFSAVSVNAEETVTSNKDDIIQKVMGKIPTCKAVGEALEKDSADNLTSWLGSINSVEDTQADSIFTTSGNESVDSDEYATLGYLAPKTLTFGATSILASGFNLLHNATAITDGYYFLVPALPFGSVGTALQPNGVLFTGRDGSNLTPTVYFKPIADGVPTSITDGNVCTSITTSGHTFYTTTEIGYLIVSGITLADTCAHIGWSSRYDEFVAPSESSDAGDSISLTAIFNAVHSSGLLYNVNNKVDSIAFTSSQAKWTRNNDRQLGSALNWNHNADEVEEDATQTYTHTATVSTMASDTAVYCTNPDIIINVSGKTLSYQDTSGNNSSVADHYIYYNLATPVTGTINGAQRNNHDAYLLDIEDWGIIMFLGVTGEGYSTITYGQNIPDNVRALVTGKLSSALSVVAEALCQLAAQVQGQQAYIKRLEAMLQPTTGSGAPTVHPGRLGEEYIDTATGNIYKAAGIRAVSDWKQINS